ncbi:MAG: sigma-70 factor domain-containing protein, partial [Candidatus Binatia bacterium]
MNGAPRLNLSRETRTAVHDRDITDEVEQLVDEIESSRRLSEEADLVDDGRASEKALVSFDPLQRYLAEIRRYPLLSREEEHRLAVEYKEFGSIKAAYK